MAHRLLTATPPVEQSSSSKDPPGYETMVWPRIKMLLDLRLRAISDEDKQILSLAQDKNLRAHAAERFEYGDAVQLYDDQTKTWQGTFKMILNIGRNCYVGRGTKIVKQPTHWARKFHDASEKGKGPSLSVIRPEIEIPLLLLRL